MALLQITRCVPHPDKLSRQQWHYRFDDRKMRLSLIVYVESSRPASRPDRRQKWRTIRSWKVYDHRAMKREDVPHPEDVRAEALREFVKLITVEE